ncbi:coiled-coil domain-containing protein 86 [Centropristis striata]|uniref:coiled-coil domain-containing protein 86 n=1 Tax=Centropristis striata TaxID=184440 RepID=UPI0027DF547D|nr:coiled-coil domain-containing protein 86 [Centropristis striata]
MSKRQTPMSTENPGSEAGLDVEEMQDPPPETRRTRSGRKVRTPAALLDSEAPVRTPSRRTRRSVLQELPAVEKKNTQETVQKLESLTEEKLSMPAEPEPGTVSEPAEPHTEAAADTHAATGVSGCGNGPLSGPAPAEKPPMSSESAAKKPRLASSGKQAPVIPLGKPKSGRVWKDRNKQRFSALVRDKPLCSSWEKKMVAKREKELVKQYSLQLREDKARQKEEKRKRREDNLKRRAENERKAEIVQVIKNTAKIKRMKKKQLRRIEKRDTLALLQKSQKQSGKAKGQKNQKVEQDLN